MTDPIEGPNAAPEGETKRPRRFSVQAALVATALLAVGVGGGATVAQMSGPSIEMAPATPVAIKGLSEGDSIVTVRGKVAEVYGRAFILADGSGRALVEAGRHRGFMADASPLVRVGQTVSVQGRFQGGTIHAAFLVGADGKVTALHPMALPRGGPGGREGRHGPHGGPGGPEGRGPDRGFDGGPDGGLDDADAPPPPPAVAVTGNSAG
ncbi:hypothetical protein [Sphingomonas sp. HMP6]|uniref:hypothetical protein n=1 Tax=Sphingomonas sp. HMP6 TaxID=1517551 RepID=UPI001596D27D|nr:hypothetical protein [Sphingomonas sp. HMP6]BCA60603.1 hypothetical protein HMP06_3372 [Sphingomonas sp. HMP6]